MDPNVQVALIGVMTTFITTLGVVAAALINNLHQRAKAAEKVVENVVDDEFDDGDVMDKMLILISEGERKERALANCRREMTRLARENRQLRAENTLLRLGRHDDVEDQPDL